MAIIFTTMFRHALDGVNLDPPEGLFSEQSAKASSHTAGQERPKRQAALFGIVFLHLYEWCSLI